MKIFHIRNHFGLYKNIMPQESSSQSILADNYGKPLSEKWSVSQFEWNVEDGSVERDIFLYLGYILVCNVKAKSAIQLKMQSDGIEFLQIDVEGKPLYFVNVLSMANGALNLHRSKVEYFKNKTTIKNVREYAFNADFNYTPLFTISEIAAGLFATDVFKDVVERNNLNGLDFKECKIVKDGFLKSIFK